MHLEETPHTSFWMAFQWLNQKVLNACFGDDFDAEFAMGFLPQKRTDFLTKNSVKFQLQLGNEFLYKL